MRWALNLTKIWCSIGVMLIATGCSPAAKVSAVFERLRFDEVAIKVQAIGKMPEFRTLSSLLPEYNLKDCEFLIKNVDTVSITNRVSSIMLQCSNTIVSNGGVILSYTNHHGWNSQQVVYETSKFTGRFQVYVAMNGDAEAKIVAILIESAKR